MQRILWAVMLSALLIGCSSTTPHAPVPKPIAPSPAKSEDFTKLDDHDLCELSFVRVDPRIDKEIKTRRLYCDKAYRFCRRQGYRLNSLAMMSCMNKENMKNQSPNVKHCFDAGIEPDDVDGMTGCLIKQGQRQASYQQDDYFQTGHIVRSVY